MKNSFDSYQLYRAGKAIKYTARIKVVMKDEVDFNVLSNAVNKAAKRYPYFCVETVIDEDGGYNLIENNRPVVTIHTRDNLPDLGSEEVNKHLIYVDTNGKEINFNICHALGGGKGFTPWFETTLYQYVCDKYNVELDCPNIIKPDSELLPNEDAQIDINVFKNVEPIKLSRKYKGKPLLFEYVNGLFNPFVKNPQHYIISLDQKDILKYAKGNDSSVGSAFAVFMFKTMSKVLPANHKVIEVAMAHNPADTFGYKNLHSDILSHIHVAFKREMDNWGLEKVGTIARSQLYLQAEPGVSYNEILNRCIGIEGLDKVKGVKAKRKYAKKHCKNLGEGLPTYCCNVNYTGQRDWGELANYVESYVFVVDGHLLIEITSMSDKLFVCFLQMLKKDKYVKAFTQVLDELNIPYEIKGPFITNHPYVQLP